MYCLFCVVLCIVCVYMCTVLLPPVGYPIAVKYIISKYWDITVSAGFSWLRKILNELFEHGNENPVSRRHTFSWNLCYYHINNCRLCRGQLTDRYVCPAGSMQPDCSFYNSLHVACDTLESCSVLQDVNIARHRSNRLTYTLHLWNLFTAFQQPWRGRKSRRGLFI